MSTGSSFPATTTPQAILSGFPRPLPLPRCTSGPGSTKSGCFLLASYIVARTSCIGSVTNFGPPRVFPWGCPMLWTTTIPFVTANCGWYKGTGCYRNTLPDNTLKQGGGELLPRVDAHDGPGGADKDSSTVDALVIWNRALKEYSRLELSFPARDRLVAISGVTENLAKHMIDSQYIAGLWQSDLSDNCFGEE